MPVTMTFTSAVESSVGPLHRWGLPARTNTTVTNSRAVSRKSGHRLYDVLFLLRKQNR